MLLLALQLASPEFSEELGLAPAELSGLGRNLPSGLSLGQRIRQEPVGQDGNAGVCPGDDSNSPWALGRTITPGARGVYMRAGGAFCVLCDIHEDLPKRWQQQRPRRVWPKHLRRCPLNKSEQKQS
jgi:hypothetical protein